MAPASASPPPSERPEGEHEASGSSHKAGGPVEQEEFGAIAIERLGKEDGRSLILYTATTRPAR